jgi:hypothetical protein
MLARKRSLVEGLPSFVFTLVCAAAALLGSSFLFLVVGLLAIGRGASPILLTLGASTAALAGLVAPIVILRRMRKQDMAPTPPTTARDLHIDSLVSPTPEPIISEHEPAPEDRPLPSQPGKPPQADRKILWPVICVLIAIVVALTLISIYYSEQSSELQVRYSPPYLVITNVWGRTIDVRNISANERTDCLLTLGLLGLDGFKPRELKIWRSDLISLSYLSGRPAFDNNRFRLPGPTTFSKTRIRATVECLD